ncbi:hypothetical protein [Azospirillum sp. TSH64]|uniref:hypothetical protein n=1 Tax=Azospirillum sp. TSH64 TaxID=652740 RepID=UPI001FFEC987|nr:hypothetical protein [Azospirillum sp. TSH64]
MAASRRTLWANLSISAFPVRETAPDADSDAAADGHVDFAAGQSDVGQFGVGHVVQLTFRTVKFNPFVDPMNDTLEEGDFFCSGRKQFTGRRLHRRVGHVDLLRLALITWSYFAFRTREINGQPSAVLRRQTCTDSMGRNFLRTAGFATPRSGNSWTNCWQIFPQSSHLMEINRYYG